MLVQIYSLGSFARYSLDGLKKARGATQRLFVLSLLAAPLSCVTYSETAYEDLEVQDIVTVMKSKEHEVYGCFAKGAHLSQKVFGIVKVRFEIATYQGQVEEVSIEQDDLGTPAISDCIRSKIKSWSFPHPRGTPSTKLSIAIPYRFHTEDHDGTLKKGKPMKLIEWKEHGKHQSLPLSFRADDGTRL